MYTDTGEGDFSNQLADLVEKYPKVDFGRWDGTRQVRARDRAFQSLPTALGPLPSARSQSHSDPPPLALSPPTPGDALL